MTNLQLSAIISQSMFVGSAYERAKNDKDFNETVFRNYARGMMSLLLRELSIKDEDIVEKAVQDFSAMIGY
tara:strand:- start:232 stop:444 length:213 start_codon:yes stop_codon:yes gene_type:complete